MPVIADASVVGADVVLMCDIPRCANSMIAPSCASAPLHDTHPQTNLRVCADAATTIIDAGGVKYMDRIGAFSREVGPRSWEVQSALAGTAHGLTVVIMTMSAPCSRPYQREEDHLSVA